MSETETRDPAVEPTPAQWVDGFRGLVRSEQEHWAANILADHRVALRCRKMSHEYRLDDLEHAAIERSGDVVVAEERLTEARAELSRLRGVVEAVQALVLDLNADADYLVPKRILGDRLRSALAPVSSSGEAESGEGDPAAQQLLRDIFGKHEDDTPAPVPSGGQADGEGEARLIAAAKVLYGDYVSEYDYAPWETCDREPFMRQAADVLAAADAAARPVLSREALREAVLAGLRVGWRDEFSAASVADVVVDHLADVLTAGDAHCHPEPIPHAASSGGQADGEGEGLTEAEKVVARLDTYTQEQHAAGIAAARRRAARPVLSREALRERLDSHWPSSGGCVCGWERGKTRTIAEDQDAYHDHLADVLTAGGEQA